MTAFFNTILIKIIPFFFAVVLHEISHGAMAYFLGDDTAKKAGRFKLHTHFDLFGSFIIPLCLCLMHSHFLIGYTKPVPINPEKFKDPIIDFALVAIAGLVSNILMAILGFFLLKNIAGPEILLEMCMHFLTVNLALFFFNLIPIPPMDGSRILAALMPQRFLEKFYAFESFGFIIIIATEITTQAISEIIGHRVNLFYLAIEKPVRGMLSLLFS
jgi:Zn-dependent protease